MPFWLLFAISVDLFMQMASFRILNSMVPSTFMNIKSNNPYIVVYLLSVNIQFTL